jgi:hypothetical protein
LKNQFDITLEVARREVMGLDHPYCLWKMDPEVRERWKNPANVVADAGPLPPGLGPMAAMIAPVDPLSPIGPGNVQWVTDVARNRLNRIKRRHTAQVERRASLNEERKLSRAETLTFREIRWAMVSPSDELLKVIGKAALSAAVAYLEDEKTKARAEGRDRSPSVLGARSADPEYNKIYVTWWRMLRRAPKKMCDRWHVFGCFYDDVKQLGPKPPFARLGPVDKSRPMGPGNVLWVTR